MPIREEGETGSTNIPNSLPHHPETSYVDQLKDTEYARVIKNQEKARKGR